jgi:hypothetical protein
LYQKAKEKRLQDKGEFVEETGEKTSAADEK